MRCVTHEPGVLKGLCCPSCLRGECCGRATVPHAAADGFKGQSTDMESLAYVIQELLYSGVCTQQAVAWLAGALHTEAVLLHRRTSQHGGQHGDANE